jgi:hypothetical protein
MFKSPNGIPKFGRRMFCDDLVLVIDSPGAIEELPDFDLCPGIRSPMRTRRKIDEETSDPNAVIIAHHGAIPKTDDSIQIESGRNLTPGLFGVSGRNRKPAVKSREEGFEEAIGHFEALNFLQSELGPEAILQGPKEPLNSPFGLRRKGRNRTNPQPLQG